VRIFWKGLQPPVLDHLKLHTAFPVPQDMGSCNKGKVPSLSQDTSGQHPTVRYLPERVKLGPLGDGVLAGLVLVYPIVIHCFAIDE